MPAEFEQTIVETRNALSPPLALYPHTMVIRELVGYSQNGTLLEPIWGNRLALYHPIKSELIRLGDEGWAVFDAFGQGSQDLAVVADQTGLGIERTKEIADDLQTRWVLLPAGQEMSVTIQPDFGKEAEVYVETTEACNMRCGGCAMGADRYLAGQAQTMKTDTLQTHMENVTRSVSEKGMKRLRFKWAGGEALMPISRKLLKEGQVIIESLRSQYPNLEISQVILTNGTHLSEEEVAELKEWDAHVSVSLWGLGEANDIARGVRRERDKYPNIIKGIQRLHEAGISYNINHVVHPGYAAQFGEFIRAMWDTEDETFVGRDWNWSGERQPIPVGIAFYRPQTEKQLKALNNFGYKQMVEGLHGGFAVMRELISRGIPIQPLDKIDYLQLFGVIPAPCGSGFNYMAIGPRGVSSCHEALFAMPDNMADIRNGTNMVDLANSEYAGRRAQLMGPNVKFSGSDPTINLALSVHGGTGCPRTTKAEHNGELGYAASTAQALYEPIIYELLSLETMRRIKTSE